MSSDRELPTDDTLMPDSSETGGIPLGMQAGAKAGGDVVDRERSKPAGEFAGGGGEIEDAAGDDDDAPPSPLTGGAGSN